MSASEGVPDDLVLKDFFILLRQSRKRKTWLLNSRQSLQFRDSGFAMSFRVHHLAFLFLMQNAVNPVAAQDEKIYTVSEVTVKPEPVMGLREFQDKWSRSVRYPEEAIRENVQGTVFIEFIVDKDSTVHDAAIRSGIGHGCDAAALKSFEELSRKGWKPGFLKTEPVTVKMVLPFFFKLVRRNQPRG
jgi:TonB family protein